MYGHSLYKDQCCKVSFEYKFTTEVKTLSIKAKLFFSNGGHYKGIPAMLLELHRGCA